MKGFWKGEGISRKETFGLQFNKHLLFHALICDTVTKRNDVVPAAKLKVELTIRKQFENV